MLEFNSEKICELVYAKIQGKKELISHFEKGKVLSFDSEEKRPLILPTPNPLPKIKLPIKLLDTFVKAFPFSSYSFENNNGAIIIFTILKNINMIKSFFLSWRRYLRVHSTDNRLRNICSSSFSLFILL